MTDSHAIPPLPLSTLGRLRVVLLVQLRELGYAVIEEHPDHVVVQINDQPHSIFLSNLSRAIDLGEHLKGGVGGVIEPISQERLIAAVEDWLAGHLRQLPSRRSIKEQFGELEQARAVLFPRLIPPAGLSAEGQRWSRPICDGFLDLALVIDQPDIVTFVTPDMVSAWGPAEAEQAAMDNLRRLARVEDFAAVADLGSLRLCATSDTYAAARSLLAEELLAPNSADGMLVAMPSRDVLFVEVLTAGSAQNLAYLALLARKSAGDLPYPISGEVFWIRAGRWIEVPIEIADGQMNIDAPPELAEVLGRLDGGRNE
jgi:hypothetical protein